MAKKKVFKTGGIYDGDPNTGFLLGERLKNYKKSEITLIKNRYDKILENLEKEIGNTTNSIEKQKNFELENKKQVSKDDQFQKTNETKINIANSKLNKDYINLIVKLCQYIYNIIFIEYN